MVISLILLKSAEFAYMQGPLFYMKEMTAMTHKK